MYFLNYLFTNFMKALRRIFFKIFTCYRRTDFKLCTWDEAQELFAKDHEWEIAHEDVDLKYPMVAIEKRKRIVE